MMSDPGLETDITPSEALAAGTATLPPEPANVPLATTLGDAGGVEVDPSSTNTSVHTLMEGLECSSGTDDDKKAVGSSFQPTLSNRSVPPTPDPRRIILATSPL